MKRVTCYLLFIWSLGSAVHPGIAYSEEMWAWVRASSIPDGWDVTKGKAKVRMQGTSFTAELFDGEEIQAPTLTLKGTIKNGRLRLRSEARDADFGSSDMAGELKTKKWGGFADSIGRQTITLTDGWNQIGITRELRAPKKSQ